LNSITEFARKIKNKNIFMGAGTLDDQKWYLALEMPTSRTAHAKREREREHTYKITSRQSLSN
jgi:hypothetical protein